MVQKTLTGGYKKKAANTTKTGKKVATKKELRKYDDSTEIPKRGASYEVRVRSHWRRARN